MARQHTTTEVDSAGEEGEGRQWFSKPGGTTRSHMTIEEEEKEEEEVEAEEEERRRRRPNSSSSSSLFLPELLQLLLQAC